MLSSKYPDCIFIERASRTYSLRKKSNDDGGATATVKQFPIKLAFCITAHKIQGSVATNNNFWTSFLFDNYLII